MAGAVTGPPTPATPSPWWRRRASPELVAGALAVLVGIAWLLPGSAGSSSGIGPSASPAAPTTGPASEPPAIDLSTIQVLSQIDDRLLASATALQALVGSDPLPTAEVVTEIRRVRSLARQALAATPRLRQLPRGDALADRLESAYTAIRTAAATDASINNAAAYRAAATALLDELAIVPSLQADLTAYALAVAGGASTPPSEPPASPSASPTPSPSPPPSASPPPGSPTAIPTPPTTAAPSSTAVPDEQLDNGGFESGGADPWKLLRESGLDATLSIDSVVHASGLHAARVEIGSRTTSRSGVSLQQSGLRLVAGGRYRLMASMRASVPFDVRLRIASPGGGTFGAQLVTVRATWQVVTLDFTAPVSGPDAIAALDFGQNMGTVWVDDVSFTEVVGVSGGG